MWKRRGFRSIIIQIIADSRKKKWFLLCKHVNAGRRFQFQSEWAKEGMKKKTSLIAKTCSNCSRAFCGWTLNIVKVYKFDKLLSEWREENEKVISHGRRNREQKVVTLLSLPLSLSRLAWLTRKICFKQLDKFMRISRVHVKQNTKEREWVRERERDNKNHNDDQGSWHQDTALHTFSQPTLDLQRWLLRAREHKSYPVRSVWKKEKVRERERERKMKEKKKDGLWLLLFGPY